MPVDYRNNPDAPMAIFANILLAAVMPITVLVAPLLVGQMVNQLHFTVSDSGYLLSFELAAICLSTAIVLLLMNRVSWRWLVGTCIVVAVAGNICSAFAHSFAYLALFRIIAGLGSGTTIALTLAAIGRTRNQDRNFGLWLISQLISAVIGLLVLPWVFQAWGIAGFFLGIAAFETLTLPIAGYFFEGRRPRLTTQAAAPTPRVSPVAVAGLISILLICDSIGGIWAYVERIGHASALDPHRIAMILAAATSMGILGAGTAAVIGGRFARTRLLAIGFAIVILAMVLLLGHPSAARYALAAAFFKFAWTFLVPFILASISSRDPSGNLIVIANFVLGGGLAAGPAVAAFILRLGGDYDRLIAVMLVSAGASATILLVPELLGAGKTPGPIK